MIPVGVRCAAELGCTLHGPDPALATLAVDLRNLHRRAELLAAHHDPRTVPQGVGDAIHDALVALSDARQLLEVIL